MINYQPEHLETGAASHSTSECLIGLASGSSDLHRTPLAPECLPASGRIPAQKAGEPEVAETT